MLSFLKATNSAISSSSGSSPDNLAALATKYGGSSPRAVPAPQKRASHLTLETIDHKVMGREALEPPFGQVILKTMYRNFISFEML